MITLLFTFPARRYHATPWDAHVNEGRIEWPPSPWRLLRGLLAVGYTKLGWHDTPPDIALSLIQKLQAVVPAYALPTATESHSRHYMPTRDKTAKVFDAFLRFETDDARMLVQFDVELTDDERSCLRKLAEGMTYLGRAESWVEASVLSDEQVENPSKDLNWCRADSATVGRPIRLLTAHSESDFQKWRSDAIARAQTQLTAIEIEKASANGKKPTAAALKKIPEKAAANLPLNLLDSLQWDTDRWQSNGWPLPPGSRWVTYQVPENAFSRRPLTTLSVTRPKLHVDIVLLAVDGNGKSGTVRPLLKRALPLMEVLHATAVHKATAQFKFGNVHDLTGKNDLGSPLRGHQHAHYLPLSLFGHEKIDHVLVWCRDGFTEPALKSLSAIRWAYSKGITDLSINMAGMGDTSTILTQFGLNPAIRSNLLKVLGTSTEWESCTPLVLRKYLHKRGKKTAEGQIREELVQRGFDEPTQICLWSAETLVARRLKGFVLQRSASKQQPPSASSWGATITFEKPQTGPITLGYGSHFGLGLFSHTPDSEEACNR
jgi:CRISPR-associated protein Csb2